MQLASAQPKLRRGWAHRFAVRGILFATAFGLFPRICPAGTEINLTNNPVTILGSIQAHLAYTDKNVAVQDYLLQNVPPPVFTALSPGLQQLQGSKLLGGQASPNGYFDQLWSNNRDAVCGQVASQVAQAIHSRDNQAYNIVCTINPHGFLFASIVNSWEDSWLDRQTGTRLVLDYYVPLNSVVFSVTTNPTCKSANVVCAADPQFTAVFGVHITVESTSTGSTSLNLVPSVSYSGSVTLDSVVAGDYSDAVGAAVQQVFINLGTSLAAEGVVCATGIGAAGPCEFLGAADFVAAIGQFLAQLGGISVAAIGNGGLLDLVSSNLSYLSSSAAGQAAQQASSDFNAFYEGLAAGWSNGFTQFGVTAGSDGSLIFRLTYPAPVQPTLHNTIADSNNSQTVVNPSLHLRPLNVGPGDQLTVTGNGFWGAYTTHLVIEWNKTVAGPMTANVSWGAAGGPFQSVTTNQNSLEVNTAPGTTYVFSLQECDPISCAPVRQFSTATEMAGADQVAFHLDYDTATPIGYGTVGPDGTVTGSVTVPPQTSPGPHTLWATVQVLQCKFCNLNNFYSAIQEASTPFTVCSGTGCTTSIQVVGNPAYLEAGFSFTLQGTYFAPGTVNVYLDGPNGVLLGSAQIYGGSVTTSCPGCIYGFTQTFTMPAVYSGYHNLVAIEYANGHTLEATLPVYVQPLPE